MDEIKRLKNDLKKEARARKRAETIAQTKSEEICQLNDRLQGTIKQRTEQLTKQSKFTERMIDILNSIDSFNGFVGETLSNISELFDFEFGHFYEYKQEREQLESSNIFFFRNKKKYQAFVDITKKTHFKKGIGLPGSAWKKMGTVYYQNVIKSTNFPRQKLAKSPINVVGGIALPIIYKGELLGVTEFFSDKEIILNSDQLSQFERLAKSISIYYGIYQENRNLRLIFNNSGEGIFGLDMEGKITFMNPQARKILGYDQKELIGHSINTILNSTDPNQSVIYKTLKEKRTQQAEDEIFVKKDGNEIIVQYSASPIHENDCAIGEVISFIDISEKEKMKRHITTTAKIQQQYIEGENQNDLFGEMLNYIIDTTNSEIGLIHINIDKTNHLEKNIATKFDNIFSCKKNRPSSSKKRPTKPSAQQIENLLNHTTEKSNPIICNDPKKQDGFISKSNYFSHLNNLLSIPIYGTQGITGLVFLANAPNGYSKHAVTELKPLINTLSNMVESSHHFAVIENMEQKDLLTQTYNRNYFEKKLDIIINEHNANNKKFCLIMMDLNNFKKINDFYGHQTGDEVIKLFSKRVAGSLRENNFLARVGGDEFIAALQNINQYQSAAKISERILNLCKQPYKVGSEEIVCGISIGIVSFPISGSTAQELMKHVDFALNKAKNSHKKWRFYSNELESEFQEATTLEQNIEQAIIEKQFYCVCQPQININDNQLFGFELLLRWNHPTAGNIPPDKFIPIIEKMEKAEAINQYVVDYLIDNLSYFRSSLPLTISINLLPCVPNLPSHIKQMAKKLKSSHYPKNITFEFEMIESTFIKKTAEMEKKLQQTMNHLAKQGIRFAIDDFGVEYSSINRLVTYRFDTIKIDQFFVKKLKGKESKSAQSIIRVVLSLAKDMGLNVIAEGAETLQQVNILKKLGCHIIQGFYFHNPLTLEITKELIETKEQSNKQAE